VADLRDDLATFARRVLGVDLWPHQLEADASRAFVTVIAAARRTGKTTYVEAKAVHTAMREAGVVVLILSATQGSARRVTESIASRLAASPLTRGAVVDDFSTRIRLSNGSEIVSLPASQRQVRGFGRRLKLLVVDEAGFVPGEVWRAAHYTALDERANGSRILLCGTPWGGAEHFFRQAFLAGERGDPDHASFRWTFEANPGLDREYLERQRHRVSPAEYAAEVLGEWSDAAGALFSRELLDRQTVDVEVPALAGLAGPARPIVGVDWGVSFDRSAAAVVYRLPGCGLEDPSPSRPRFLLLPYVWPAKTPLRQVVEEVAGAPPSWRFIAAETNGIGGMPCQELERAIKGRDRHKRTWLMVATSNRSKTAGYGCLLGLLEAGQLLLPRDPALLRQMAGLRFEQGERGFTRIEAENPAVHDDVADAAYLAALPYAKGGRFRCGLQELANPAVAVPDAEVAPLDCEVVQSPGGALVYRRPALQSVRGPEVSLFAPPAPAARTRAEERALQEARRAIALARNTNQEE
jgi:hypothetical protein